MFAKIKGILFRKTGAKKDALYDFYVNTKSGEKNKIYKRVIEMTNRDQQKMIQRLRRV
jgi:hypothetical protein